MVKRKQKHRPPAEIATDKVRLSSFPKDVKFYVIVELEERKPIGFVGLSKNNELRDLFIEPKYRKKGYGTDVLTLMHKIDPNLSVTTSTRNTPMAKLLEKLGFKKWFRYVTRC